MSPLVRASIAAVWLGTAVVSVFDGGRAGAALLMGRGFSEPLALTLVGLGAAWDALLGLLLLWRPTRPIRLAAAAGLLAMTAIATALFPQLWLDPLGPLLKNLPLLALLLERDEPLPAR